MALNIPSDPDEQAGTPALVTFALFAYNQEKYIRQAIEAAFAQTYQPLEIILSDDCSADGTFAIIQEMAASYAGPHRIVSRRNEANLGLIDHVNTVLMQAQGDYVVLAAGDDISVPDRTSVLTEGFRTNPNAFLMHSRAALINARGHSEGSAGPMPASLSEDLRVIAVSTGLHLGATAAIRRDLQTFFGPIRERMTYEDLTLGFRAALLKGIQFIDHELVEYRVDTGFSDKKNYHSQNRLERRKYFALLKATMIQRLADLATFETKTGEPQPELRRHLQQYLIFSRIRAALWDWQSDSLFALAVRHPLLSIRSVFSELRYVAVSKRARQTGASNTFAAARD